MLQTLNRTSVGVKGKGEPLTAADINSINKTVNNCVDTINRQLKEFCDINIEDGTLTQTYTLAEAIVKVPATRRCIGLKIKFKDTADSYKEYTFVGDSINASVWENTDNWVHGLEIIDGGIW